MKVNRSKFIQHLERLHCAGQCTEVVFRGAFASDALTPDQMLLVSTPNVGAVEALAEEIGVADIALLISSLKLLAGEGNLGVEVNVYVEGNRLVIDDGDRGVQRLILAAPRTIATRIELETVQKVLAGLSKSTGQVPLTRSVVDGVRGAFKLYKAEEVEITVGPKGSKISVGGDLTHRAEFSINVKSKEEYSLLFGKHLVDVFSIIADYSSATLSLSGPQKNILITDGENKYMLSPRLRSADEVKSAVKDDGADSSDADDAGGSAPDEAEVATPPKAKAKGGKKTAGKK